MKTISRAEALQRARQILWNAERERIACAEDRVANNFISACSFAALVSPGALVEAKTPKLVTAEEVQSWIVEASQKLQERTQEAIAPTVYHAIDGDYEDEIA